jgi:hypothetical protein
LNEPSSIYPIPVVLSGPITHHGYGDYQYTVNGGYPNYHYSISSDGSCYVNESSGLVTVGSLADFTVSVTDSSGQTAVLLVTYTYDAAWGLIVTGNDRADVGIHTYTTSVGTPPYTWTLSNAGYNYTEFPTAFVCFDNGGVEAGDMGESINVNVYVAIRFLLSVVDADGNKGAMWVNGGGYPGPFGGSGSGGPGGMGTGGAPSGDTGSSPGIGDASGGDAVA